MFVDLADIIKVSSQNQLITLYLWFKNVSSYLSLLFFIIIIYLYLIFFCRNSRDSRFNIASGK